jgi:large conductance mechanosensitive channel
MKNFFADFRNFLMRGNVLDLAIGVVIGTSFNNITTSLVNNVITPPLGILLGNIDFKNWGLNLGGSVNIQYGLFIQAVISFIITAFALFLLIKFIAHVKRIAKDDPAPPPPTPAEKTPELVVLEEIRDSLKNQSGPASI